MNDANVCQAWRRPYDRRAGSRRRGAWALSAATLIFLSLTSRVDAIQFIQDYNEIDRPSFDPNGTELRRIATAAAIRLESPHLHRFGIIARRCDRAASGVPSLEDRAGRVGVGRNFATAVTRWPSRRLRSIS